MLLPSSSSSYSSVFSTSLSSYSLSSQSSTSSVSSSDTDPSPHQLLTSHFLEQINNPHREQFGDPTFREQVITLLTAGPDRNLDDARATLIKKVRAQGTITQLNLLLADLRRNGMRAYFPAMNMGTIDYCIYRPKTGALIWKCNNEASEGNQYAESSEWRYEAYKLDSENNKWRPVNDRRPEEYLSTRD